MILIFFSLVTFIHHAVVSIHIPETASFISSALVAFFCSALSPLSFLSPFASPSFLLLSLFSLLFPCPCPPLPSPLRYPHLPSSSSSLFPSIIPIDYNPTPPILHKAYFFGDSLSDFAYYFSVHCPSSMQLCLAILCFASLAGFILGSMMPLVQCDDAILFWPNRQRIAMLWCNLLP